jgi:hypothetical protein
MLMARDGVRAFTIAFDNQLYNEERRGLMDKVAAMDPNTRGRLRRRRVASCQHLPTPTAVRPDRIAGDFDHCQRTAKQKSRPSTDSCRSRVMVAQAAAVVCRVWPSAKRIPSAQRASTAPPANCSV